MVFMLFNKTWQLLVSKAKMKREKGKKEKKKGFSSIHLENTNFDWNYICDVFRGAGMWFKSNLACLLHLFTCNLYVWNIAEIYEILFCKHGSMKLKGIQAPSLINIYDFIFMIKTEKCKILELPSLAENFYFLRVQM